MKEFHSVLGNCFYNSYGIFLYSSGLVTAENIVTCHARGKRKFASVQAAQDWFESLADDSTARVLEALDTLRDD